MTERRQPEGTYIPSPPAALAGLILTIGIVALGVIDAFRADYDARATIAILAVLVGGIFGFDYRHGRWRGDPLPPAEPSPPELDKPTGPPAGAAP